MSHPVWVTRLGLGAATYALLLSCLVTITNSLSWGDVQLDGNLVESFWSELRAVKTGFGVGFRGFERCWSE
jgi:hypothetical protein